jgi:hypothetical protein
MDLRMDAIFVACDESRATHVPLLSSVLNLEKRNDLRLSQNANRFAEIVTTVRRLQVTNRQRCSGYAMVNGLLRRNAIKTTAQFCGVNKPPSVFAGIFALIFIAPLVGRVFYR